MNDQQWLKTTPIVDHDAPKIRELVRSRGWERLPEFERIGAAYSYVKDELRFGYNRSDDLRASEVLRDGYGQCNTKGNLLVALLRALGVPTRFHGFTIAKALQRGAIPAWMYPLAPSRILHSWVEVLHDGRWIPLEGFILDDAYLRALQVRFSDANGPFCGYGVATPDLQRPAIAWTGEPTYIQRDGIVDDLGIFDHPDDLYARHGTNLSGVRRLLYAHVLRFAMNATVEGIRRASTSGEQLRSVADRPMDRQLNR